MKQQKIEKKKTYFVWYDWFFSILTIGIYTFIKMQKINYEFESLQKRISNLTETYQYDINNKTKLYEQKISYIEKQKNEKDKRIYELKTDLEKRIDQITKLLKDKEEQLTRHSKDKDEQLAILLKAKDEHIKIKNDEISKLNNENGSLKSQNKTLNEEQIKNEGIIKQKILQEENLNKKIIELEQQIALEKRNDINVQLMNSNPHDCSKNLTDYVMRVYEECFGELQKYAKLETEKNIQSENNKNKRADFVITFYKNQPENTLELQENFRVVIECKSHDAETNDDKLIDNKHFQQLIEYSRLFNAKYAILLTNLKFDKQEQDFPFKCINDWSKLKIKGLFKSPNDADLFIVRPDYFELFLKIFRFLNDSTSFNKKFKKINKSIDMKSLWEFINAIKSELDNVLQLKKHLHHIEEKNKKVIKTANEVNKYIQTKIIPSVDQISYELSDRTDEMEISLPHESKKIALPAKKIEQTVEIEKDN